MAASTAGVDQVSEQIGPEANTSQTAGPVAMGPGGHTHAYGCGHDHSALHVGAASDPYEVAADRAADLALARLAGAGRLATDLPAAPAVVRRKASVGAAGGEAPADVSARIHAARGRGSALNASLRTDMESAFGGASFSGVRVHSGAEAADLSAAVGATAFTVGKDVFLGATMPSLDTAQGQHTLAHELAHTLQPTVGVRRNTTQQPPSRGLFSRVGNTLKKVTKAVLSPFRSTPVSDEPASVAELDAQFGYNHEVDVVGLDASFGERKEGLVFNKEVKKAQKQQLTPAQGEDHEHLVARNWLSGHGGFLEPATIAALLNGRTVSSLRTVDLNNLLPRIRLGKAETSGTRESSVATASNSIRSTLFTDAKQRATTRSKEDIEKDKGAFDPLDQGFRVSDGLSELGEGLGTHGEVNDYFEALERNNDDNYGIYGDGKQIGSDTVNNGFTHMGTAFSAFGVLSAGAGAILTFADHNETWENRTKGATGIVDAVTGLMSAAASSNKTKFEKTDPGFASADSLCDTFGGVAGIASTIKEGFDGLVTVLDAIRAPGAMEDSDKLAVVLQTAQSALGAVKGVLSTVDSFLDNVGAAATRLAQTVPAMGIVIAGINWIQSMVSLVFSVISKVQMDAEKEQHKDIMWDNLCVLEPDPRFAQLKAAIGSKVVAAPASSHITATGNTILAAKEPPAPGTPPARVGPKNTSSPTGEPGNIVLDGDMEGTYDARKKGFTWEYAVMPRGARGGRLYTGAQTGFFSGFFKTTLGQFLNGATLGQMTGKHAQRLLLNFDDKWDQVGLADHPTYVEARKSALAYENYRDLEKVSGKRIHRAALNLVAGALSIAGGIVTLSGVGAAVGTGLNAGGAALKGGAGLVRWISQTGADFADRKKVAPGGEVTGGTNKKTTRAKAQMYDRMIMWMTSELVAARPAWTAARTTHADSLRAFTTAKAETVGKRTALTAASAAYDQAYENARPRPTGGNGRLPVPPPPGAEATRTSALEVKTSAQRDLTTAEARQATVLQDAKASQKRVADKMSIVTKAHDAVVASGLSPFKISVALNFRHVQRDGDTDTQKNYSAERDPHQQALGKPTAEQGQRVYATWMEALRERE